MTRRLTRWTTAVAVALVGAGAAMACAAASARLSQEQAEEIVKAHNAWRRMVGVQPLRWSDGLARAAQARAENLAADGCRLSHRGLPRDVGENLFASVYKARVRTEDLQPMGPAEIVNLWASEAADYDYARNRCAAGKQCAHYTQIVARRTKEVGCGMALCPSRGQVWACDYSPAGNVEGRKPY